MSYAVSAGEVPRHDPSLIGWLRCTTRPTDLGGTTLPTGARLLLLLGSAALDEHHRLADPHTFNHQRAALPTTLNLGAGIHFCPGALYVRYTAQHAIAALTRALRHLTLTHAHAPPSSAAPATCPPTGSQDGFTTNQPSRGTLKLAQPPGNRARRSGPSDFWRIWAMPLPRPRGLPPDGRRGLTGRGMSAASRSSSRSKGCCRFTAGSTPSGAWRASTTWHRRRVTYAGSVLLVHETEEVVLRDAHTIRFLDGLGLNGVDPGLAGARPTGGRPALGRRSAAGRPPVGRCPRSGPSHGGLRVSPLLGAPATAAP